MVVATGCEHFAQPRASSGRYGVMQRFQDIHVWQRAHRIVVLIYAATDQFPAEERQNVVQQLRRAAVSVPTNIAEGSKRLFRRDYVRFLNIAEGSLTEVEYLLLLSRDLRFGDDETLEDLLREVDVTARMLANLRKAVQTARRKATESSAGESTTTRSSSAILAENGSS